MQALGRLFVVLFSSVNRSRFVLHLSARSVLKAAVAFSEDADNRLL